jgi:hypothetical protein
MDPIHGAAQALTKALPESIVEKGGMLNEWLRSKGIPLAEIPSGGVSQQIQEAESAYQQARAQEGETGVDWSRMAGNVLSPAYLGLGGLVGPAATLPGRMAQGAGLGAAYGGMQPVTQGDYAEEKAKQAIVGGLAGGAMPALFSGAARMISPKPPKGIEALAEEGIPVTVGQRLGGLAKTIEDRLTSVPGTGHMIEKARGKGYQEFNRAALDRALKPIKKSLPKGLDVHEGLTHTRIALSGAYDDLLSKMTGKIDDKFTSEFNNIAAKAEATLPENLAALFKKRVIYETQKRVSKDGNITGKDLKAIQEGIRNNYEKFSGSQDAFQREMGDMFEETLDAFNRMLSRNNPKYAMDLKRINSGYANFKRVQRAATSVGADEFITPAQLHSAIKALDKSKDKRAFSENAALMQDLSRAAKSVLPSKTPSSGTTERTLMTNPITGGLSMLGTAPLMPLYTGPGGRLAQTMLTHQRPAFAKPVANIVQNLPPYLTPGAVAGGYGLLNGGNK